MNQTWTDAFDEVLQTEPRVLARHWKVGGRIVHTEIVTGPPVKSRRYGSRDKVSA